MKLDLDKIRTSAKAGTPLAIRSHRFTEASRPGLEGILRVYLEELGQPGLFPSLSFCLRELLDHARRALPAEPVADEAPGLRVTFWIQDFSLVVTVAHRTSAGGNGPGRAEAQLAQAWAGGTLVDTLAAPSEDGEGGLGLAVLVLVLRRLGLDQRSVEVRTGPEETAVTLHIPMARIKAVPANQFTQDIASFVDSIPPFPDNLRRLFRLLEDPGVEFGLLAAELARDPALTADLIKYINSAAVHGPHDIADLETAIRIVGTQGLKDLMYPYGAHRILAPYLAKQKLLWENAASVSRYASALAREFRFDWHEKGRTQIAGLLYNLGQIVLTFLYPDLSLKILDHCRKKGLSIQTFDALTQTVNPAVLGSVIAERWNFPDDLILILRHQAAPLQSPESLRLATTAVYLASCLRSVEQGLLTYDQVSPEALDVLELDSNQLEGLHERLRGEHQGAVFGGR